MHKFVSTCTYAETHICTHIHTDTYTHKDAHICIHRHICTHTHIYRYTQNTDAHICIHMHLCAHTYMHTHTYRYIYTNTDAHTCIHTYLCTDTHTLLLPGTHASLLWLFNYSPNLIFFLLAQHMLDFGMRENAAWNRLPPLSSFRGPSDHEYLSSTMEVRGLSS